MSVISGNRNWSKVAFLYVDAFLGLSFTLLIVDASFVASAFLVAKPLINWFDLGVEVLGDGSATDHNASVIQRFTSCK